MTFQKYEYIQASLQTKLKGVGPVYALDYRQDPNPIPKVENSNYWDLCDMRRNVESNERQSLIHLQKKLRSEHDPPLGLITAEQYVSVCRNVQDRTIRAMSRGEMWFYSRVREAALIVPDFPGCRFVLCRDPVQDVLPFCQLDDYGAIGLDDARRLLEQAKSQEKFPLTKRRLLSVPLQEKPGLERIPLHVIERELAAGKGPFPEKMFLPEYAVLIFDAIGDWLFGERRMEFEMGNFRNPSEVYRHVDPTQFLSTLAREGRPIMVNLNLTSSRDVGLSVPMYSEKLELATVMKPEDRNPELEGRLTCAAWGDEGDLSLAPEGGNLSLADRIEN